MWLTYYMNALISSPLLTSAFTLLLTYWGVLLVVGLKAVFTGFLWEFWSQGKIKNRYDTWLYTKLFYKSMKGCNIEVVHRGFDRYRIFNVDIGKYLGYGGVWEKHSFNAKEFVSEDSAKERLAELVEEKIFDEYTPAYLFLPILLVPIAFVADWLLFNAPMQTLLVLTIAAVVAIVMFGGRYMYSFSEKVAKLDEATKKEE